MTKVQQNAIRTARIRKVEEASEVLSAVGFVGRQRNEVAAHTLLALLGLEPLQSWSTASAPLHGITPIIQFVGEFYGVRYAPNTRETVRDEAVKHFVEAGMLMRNPDAPTRPTNSVKTVYQIEPQALKLFRSFGGSRWRGNLKRYLASREQIRRELGSDRSMARVPVALPNGQRITLSPGGQNPLIKAVIEEFCSRFVPGGKVLYVGDAESKFLHLDTPYLASLGIELASAAKMPDVVVHATHRNWLVLVEAVTSAGPVDGKRRAELKHLFSGSTAGLVFVTAFASRAAMRSFLTQISWETEVWIAEDPDHLIHFNGERFLGPYPDVSP
jgi:hypothetical protein